jgi:hypothetical protein
MTGKKEPLSVTHPELAAQADGWDPSGVLSGSNKKLSWICPLGHSHYSVVFSRARNGTGCPICANQQVLAGFNDLATTHPELAEQADGWDPTTIVSGTNKKLAWICKRSHSWNATVNSRTSQGTNCPICINKKVLVGFNDLATTHPELAAQADGWDPTTVIGGNHKTFDWKCTYGHTWRASLTNRTFKSTGCPICVNKKVLVGFNDLATTHPELAAQADGWDPTTVSFSSAFKRLWKCKIGHTWICSVDGRRKGLSGCPICANQQVLVGFNDLATTHPELAEQADGWDPTTVIGGSSKTFDWKCPIGHAWRASLTNRTSRSSNCPICANQQVLAGFNDLATTHPELAEQADGWDPTTVNSGSNKKYRWICNSGHMWNAVLASRSRLGVGCPTCAKFGFDPNLPGWLYFIDHDALAMFQIGISNFPDNRLAQHSKRGWEVIEVRGPMEGQLAQQLELAILHAVERRGGVLGHKAEIEKFDGYSEAWTKDSLTVTSFKQLLGWVYEDDKTIVM